MASIQPWGSNILKYSVKRPYEPITLRYSSNKRQVTGSAQDQIQDQIQDQASDPTTGPEIDSKNPISKIYRFRGSFIGVELPELIGAKDWIAPPTLFCI